MTDTTFFGRALRSVAALAFVVLAQPALAVFNCEIVPAGPTTAAVERGSSASLPFNVTGLGCGSSITTDVSIVSNTTGVPTLPPTETNGPGPRSPSVQVGNSVGTLVVRVTCTAGCFGSPANLTIDYTIDATPFRTLDPIGSTTFSEEVGASGTISVRALDDASPAGTVVLFNTSGPVTVAPTSANTDPGGVATVTATFGPGTGPATITAERLDAPGVTVTYSIDVVAVQPRAIFSISGDDQSGQTGSSVAQPLVVEVRDSGATAAGVGINWSVVSGDATLVAPTSPSDGAGRAQTGVLFGPTDGAVVVRATRADDASVFVEFNLFSFIIRDLNIVSGNNQVGLPNTVAPQPLVVEVTNNGVPVPGIAVNWAVFSAPGSATLIAPQSTTDASGRAQSGLQFGPDPGPVAIGVQRLDNTDFSRQFSATIVTLLRTVALVSGDGQNGTVGTALANPLVIEARDNGVAAPGIAMNWSVVSGDATLVAPSSPTDAAGRAQTGLLFGPTPGPVVVRATRADDPTATYDFNVVSAAITRTIVQVSGNGQTAATGTALPSPLVIEARNNGLGAPGTGITWSVVSGDATLVAPTSPTDAAGRAQTGVQFGATPGTVVIRAARADDAAVTTDFSVTSTFTRTITLVSGGNQLGLPGLPLPNPIVLEVRGNGQPEAGVSVNIEVQGDATLSGDGDVGAKLVRVTDGSGRVSAVVTLGPTSSGAVNIQVSVPASPGVTTTVTAAANSLANVPGLTGPQREIGDVIQLACAAITQIPAAARTAEQTDLLARCQSLVGADPTQIADALDELLPDTSLAMVNVALQAGQAQLDNLKARIAALRSGTRGRAFGGLALASPVGVVPVASLLGQSLNADDAPEVGAGFDRWGYFVSGTIGRGEAEPGQRTPAYDFDINGLTAGLDYRFSDGFVGGASVGYTRQDTDLAGGEGQVEADGFSLSAYATFYRDQSWYTDAVLSWGRNDYDTLRRIRYSITGPGGTTTVDQIARGQLAGDSLSLASTVGRDYQAGSWNIGPYGRVLYSRIDFDAGREVIGGGGAGSGLALEIFPGAHTSVASVLGTKFSTALSRDWGILMPHFQIEWEHEYRDDPQRVGARFLADPNATRFNIDGDPIDSSFFRLGAGLSVLFAGGRSGFLYVERVVGKSGFSQTNVALGIRGEF